MLVILGAILHMNRRLIWLGSSLFAAVVVLPNREPAGGVQRQLPGEDALVAWGSSTSEELRYVSKVLNAAALTYVAATLQAIMTLLYYLHASVSGGTEGTGMRST